MQHVCCLFLYVSVMYLTLLLVCKYVTQEEVEITHKRNSGAYLQCFLCCNDLNATM